MKNFKICFSFFLFLLLLLLFPKDALAVTVSISNLPASIDHLQESEVDIALSCSGCGDSYFRGVFYPSDSNYFGFTQNNSGSWIGSVSDRTQYFKVAKTDLVEGSWSGKLRIKPDPTDPAYFGPSNYFFKAGRYTSASDSDADWSKELTLIITGPTPTSTPSPTNTPTSTSTPTPTSTGTPTNTPTLTPTPVSNSISGSFSSPQIVGKEFDISVTLSNFEVSKEYYLKARIGLSESELNKGETENSGSWYGDTAAWSNFPKVTINASGGYSGSITAKLKSEQSSGNYKLKVRARKVDNEASYKDSSLYDITFNSASSSSPTSTPTLSPTPTLTAKSPTSTPTPKSTVKLSPTPTSNPEVLGEKIATAEPYLLISPASASPTSSSKTSPERKNFLPLLLVFFGIILIGASIFSFRLIRH